MLLHITQYYCSKMQDLTYSKFVIISKHRNIDSWVIEKAIAKKKVANDKRKFRLTDKYIE
jgi:hypothetical protein